MMMIADPEDAKAFVRVLRALRGWNKQKLAREAGLDPSTIVRYEKGQIVPPPATLARLVAAIGMPLVLAERLFLPLVRLSRLVVAAEPGAAPRAGLPWQAGSSREGDPEVAAFADAMSVATGAALGLLGAELAQCEEGGDPGRPGAGWEGGLPRRAGWSGIEEVVAALEGQLTSTPRRWLLAESLCSRSVEAAPHSAAEALRLARLAVQAAAQSKGSRAWRSRLRGFARAFLANALRVAGRLREAEAEFAAAWRLWRGGAAGDPHGVLPEWRLLDLEASLRRDQRRFPEALALLDRARQTAPAGAAGRLGLSKAFILEQTGEFQAAGDLLREVTGQVEAYGTARDRLVAAFNSTVNLCHLCRYEEAQESFGNVCQLATVLGNDLDEVRIAWLGGRVAMGLGNREEAREALEKVRDQFSERSNGVAMAAVTLELAVLYLENGRTAEVKDLAQAMAWVFSSEGIARETLAALRLFCDAARQEKATLVQARRLLVVLERGIRAAGGAELLMA